MKTRRKIWLLLSFAFTFILLIAFVLGDYFELYGVLLSDGISHRSFKFKILDKERNQVVNGVEIEVRRLEEQHLSSPRNCQYHDDTAEGTVSGFVSVWISTTQTRLFEKQRTPADIDMVNFQFESRHPSYKTQKQIYQAKDLEQLQIIELEALE